jgi:hypothetical protein
LRGKVVDHADDYQARVAIAKSAAVSKTPSESVVKALAERPAKTPGEPIAKTSGWQLAKMPFRRSEKTLAEPAEKASA